MKRHLSRLGIASCLACCSSAIAATPQEVGITVGSLGNPYFAATDNGIGVEARKLTPGARLTVVSADYDLNKQFTQIDNFIAAGDKIIMLNAVDPVAIAPAISGAHRAGIVVAAFDVAANGADITVMTDNVKAGAEACQYIVDHLPKGGGDVVILNGPQVSSIRDRVSGCRQVLSQHAGIHLLSFDQNAQASRDGGLAVGQSILTRYPHLDGVFAINDPTAIGMDLAARQLHRADFFITSVDGAPDIVSQLQDRQSHIKASAAQDPFGMAAMAYQFAIAIENRHPPSSKIVLLSPHLVTANNVADYKGWNGVQ